MTETPRPKLLEWEEARKIVIETVTSLRQTAVEQVPLAEAHGRILAAAVIADRDYPALRRSLRDGFALRAGDTPGVLQILGEARAGSSEQITLQPGQALEIMTGAPVPEGADAVVMVEHITRDNGSVKVEGIAQPGQFVNDRGAEAGFASTLISAGARIDASHITTLAMTGHLRVPVVRRPLWPSLRPATKLWR